MEADLQPPYRHSEAHAPTFTQQNIHLTQANRIHINTDRMIHTVIELGNDRVMHKVIKLGNDRMMHTVIELGNDGKSY